MSEEAKQSVEEAQAQYGDHVIIDPATGERDKQAEWEAIQAELDKLPEDSPFRDPELQDAYRQHILRDLNPEEQAMFDKLMADIEEENARLKELTDGEYEPPEMTQRDIEALKDFVKSSSFSLPGQSTSRSLTIDDIRDMQRESVPESVREIGDQQYLGNEDLANQYDVSRGIDAPESGDYDLDRLDYERMKARAAEVAPDKNIHIDRSDVSESQYRQAKMLALEEAGLDLSRIAEANLSTEQLEDLARQLDTGKLEAGEVTALFNKMASGDTTSLNLDPNNPVEGLNLATVDGRLPEGSSWEMVQGGDVLGNHAKITIDDPAKLDDIRNALNAAGVTVLQGEAPVMLPKNKGAEK